jgi:hypothetical protein
MALWDLDWSLTAHKMKSMWWSKTIKITQGEEEQK